jgi:hypothetical protein
MMAPHVFMVVLWALILGGFFLGPFTILPSPGSTTLLFLLACVATFALSSMAGYSFTAQFVRHDRKRTFGMEKSEILATSAFQRLSIAALVGVLCIVIDRISDSGSVGLEEFAELRYERADELATASDLSRGPLTYLGYVLYPGIYLVCALGFLCYERLDGRAKVLLVLAMLCPFLLAVLYGGRSPILVLFLLFAASCVVRKLLGKSRLPSGKEFKLLGALAIVAFVVYTNLVWFVRIDVTSSTSDMLLDHAARVWGIVPGNRLVDLLDGWDMYDALLPITGLYFYLFQSPATVEKLLAIPSVPVMFGAGHIDIFAAAFRLFEPTRQLLSDGYATLLDAAVYGYFPGAWGSLYVDMSLLIFPFTAIWGWISGTTFSRLKARRGFGDAVFYVFLFYTIIISPISGPFGLANSFSSFLYFLGFTLWIRHRTSSPRVAVGRRNTQSALLPEPR